MPREIQPIDFRLGAQAFAPVQLSAQFQALLVVGGQVQCGDLRAIGVDLALQRQRYRAFFGRQRGIADQRIAVFQVTGAGELQLIELQGVR
ncbi:hypothetical protein D3C87_1282500 [compost metagenome]